MPPQDGAGWRTIRVFENYRSKNLARAAGLRGPAKAAQSPELEFVDAEERRSRDYLLAIFWAM